MEESGQMERIELLEEIKRMLENATEKELDIHKNRCRYPCNGGLVI